jgi:phosphatidylglycerophosphate synthase
MTMNHFSRLYVGDMTRIAPTLLTVTRIAIALPFATALYQYELTLSVALLLLAAITDVMDGWMARRFAACSPAGAYLDAGADFVLVGAGFSVLVIRGVYPAWLLLVLAFMFAQFVIGSRSGRTVYDPIGKYYGTALYGALFALMLLPDALLSEALLVAIVGLSGLSITTRLPYLARQSA